MDWFAMPLGRAWLARPGRRLELLHTELRAGTSLLASIETRGVGHHFVSFPGFFEEEFSDLNDARKLAEARAYCTTPPRLLLQDGNQWRESTFPLDRRRQPARTTTTTTTTTTTEGMHA